MSTNRTILYFGFLMILTSTEAIDCLEGSDCFLDASCGECSGAACTRITSYNMDDNREIALTCLPYDTKAFTTISHDEPPCRKIGDREICICMDYDYCNEAINKLGILSFFSLLVIFR